MLQRISCNNTLKFPEPQYCIPRYSRTVTVVINYMKIRNSKRTRKEIRKRVEKFKSKIEIVVNLKSKNGMGKEQIRLK